MTVFCGDDDNQLQPEDTLIDDGLDDVLDEGISPPERAYRDGDPDRDAGLDELLAREEPDPETRVNVLFDEDEQRRADEAERAAEFPEREEVGDARAGRLVAPDEGFGEDTEAELVGEDVGISGGAVTAEEAAMHIIDETG